jgi:hypothetical protein
MIDMANKFVNNFVLLIGTVELFFIQRILDLKLFKKNTIMALGNYMILRSVTADDLAEMVNDWMSKGWTPQGGVAIMMSKNDTIYAQALIRS